MRLEVGPFPSAGAREWITQARGLVAIIRSNAPMPFAVPPEVLDEFESYFGDWDRAADEDPFVWSREVDPVLLRPLMTYWFNLAQYLADHPESQPPGSLEAREFYRTLIAAILTSWAAQDPDARPLQERWPYI